MIPRIHPDEVKAKLNAGEPVVLLDVRQANEHAYCRLEPSEHIPLHELSERWNELDVPAGALVVVYCHHGVRSLSGAAILMQAGLNNVASMSGGIEAWSLLVDPNVKRY